ncbi:lysine--tRNA ligase [Clostridium oryzae]|uniref:Lysine--tRNA ligase n=1 Tax=Clostridium oryzae TaxID=1450648 RepID=A0A1V4I998_9CLOT|nr:lysine--tRNA ligase [Clostridium oryzae]OPJ56571.1 lysine--tRNA ligase [Clostridium oryzae]
MYEQYVDIKKLKEIMPDANEVIIEKINKMNQLMEEGINPYPYSYDKVTHSDYIINNYHSINSEESFNMAGRIMLLRRMGNATFMNISDQTGDIQLYVSKNNIGQEKYKLIKLIDVGDLIGVKGTVFKTKTEEITIRVTELTVLSKAIRPLPEKYHGIQDMDLRQRHRSLDMIMNNEVKERFINRSKAMSALREFLNERDFIEVDTPVLDTKYGGGEAKPFITEVNSMNTEVYMNVSPELYLKRMMVGGIERVYTLARSFRNEGIDKTHYPEFTLFECYMAYADYNDMMELMESLYQYVFNKVIHTTKVVYEGVEIDFKAPWKREKMCDLVKRHTHIEVENLSKEEIVNAIEQKELLKTVQQEGFIIREASKGELIMTLFDEYCVQNLIQPTFVIDFPMDSSPLCKIHRDNPDLIERFEPYAYGIELGNAYSELNDSLRQRVLLNEQASKLRAGLETASPMDEEFAVAIDTGMPPAGGLGIGIDRMIMFLTGAASIKDVIAFPLVKR